MLPTSKLAGRASMGGASQGGTPDRQNPLPTHSDLKSLPAIDHGPIKSIHDARKWLETKGWILAAEPYDHTKLVNILVTAALTSKHEDLKRASLAVAFILDANVTDRISEGLADAVAAKAAARLGEVNEKLYCTSEFLAASDAARADSTLSLSKLTTKLTAVSAALNTVTSRLAATAPPSTAPVSWATIAKASANRPLRPAMPPQQASAHSDDVAHRIHQCILRDARTVLCQFDPHDAMAPKDLSMNGSANLRAELNTLLSRLDKKEALLTATEEGEVPSTRCATHVIGLKLSSSSAYLIKFDTADSAVRFQEYATDNWALLALLFGDGFVVINKSYGVIARFVPCTGSFDPDSDACLRTIEMENNLPTDSIVSASWLKRPDLCHKGQTVASLKLTCRDPNAANDLVVAKSRSAKMCVNLSAATNAKDLATSALTVRKEMPAPDVQPPDTPLPPARQQCPGACPAAHPPLTPARTGTALHSGDAARSSMHVSRRTTCPTSRRTTPSLGLPPPQGNAAAFHTPTTPGSHNAPRPPDHATAH
ncbi:hypothetical protein C0992_001765 [Termitomyces sp. T32_za158]|nr:hypothetical protein C0992_001765 [Termitomyces sp. T32_za158]